MPRGPHTRGCQRADRLGPPNTPGASGPSLRRFDAQPDPDRRAATEARFDMTTPGGAHTLRLRAALYDNSGPAWVIGSHFAEPTAGRIVPDGRPWKTRGLSGMATYSRSVRSATSSSPAPHAASPSG